MTKFTIIALALFLSNCTHKKESSKNITGFRSFEIGYTNGWTDNFSFWTGSNYIFFSPQKSDSIKYGILPDSILRIIDTALIKMISDPAIKSKDDECQDCPIVALRALTGTDTISIRQVGHIDTRLWPVISTLQNFIDSNSHPTMHAIVFLETQKAVSYPVPPVISRRKFLRPDIKPERER